MFGIGRKNFRSSIIPVYLFLFIFIINKFLLIHSLVIIRNDQDQNQLDNFRHSAIGQLVYKHTKNLEDDSSSDENNIQSSWKIPIQRRFCCMNPYSGRKRFIRDLTRKQKI